MARLNPINVDALAGEQKRVYELIMATRPHGLSGPFGVWVHNSRVAEPCEWLQNAFRLHSKLDRRLAELLVLLVAREYTAQYAWYLHEKLAKKDGLDVRTIDAIRARQVPDALRADEQIIYDVVSELLASKKISASTYERAVEALGLEVMVEVVTAVGFYGMACLTLNAFEVAVPEDASPLT
jgi:4-carboxymuconolactone decarboxylase